MMSLPPLSKAFVWGRGGKAMTPEELQRERAMADALMRSGADFSPAKGGWLEVAGRGLQGVLGGYEERRASAGEKANAETNSSLIARMLSGVGSPTQSDAASSRVAAAFGDAPATDQASARVSAAFNAQQPEALKQGIIETAKAIGANPVDLATAISYETGGTFDPMKKGPTTQYGQHKGLIQFGGPQREKYGVDLSSPDAALSSQLGASGAIAKYMLASGFKPGMSGMDLYSTINAGRPGRYGASDANNGGAPGSVADKWNKQMAGHRAKAVALLGADASTPVTAYAEPNAAQVAPQVAAQVAAQNDSVGDDDPYAAVYESAKHWNPDAPEQQVAAQPQVVQPQDPARLAELARPKPMPYEIAESDIRTPAPSAHVGPYEINTQDVRRAVFPPAPQPVTYAPARVGASMRIPQPLTPDPDYPMAGSSNNLRTIAGALYPPAPTPQTGAGGGVNPSPAKANNAFGIDPAIIEALSSPYSSPQTQRIAGMLLDRQQAKEQAAAQAAAQAADPVRQLQLRKAQLEVAAMENPQVKPIEVNGRLINPSTGKVIADYSDPKTTTVGNTVIDTRTGKPIYEGAAEPTSNMRDYEAYARDEKAAGRAPLNRLQYEQEVRKAGASSVTTNLGGEGAFDKEFAKNDAQALSMISTAGMAAQRNIGRINHLGALLEKSPSGFEALAKEKAGEWGINTEGMDNLQAAKAMINSLVPEQRAPGSGTMSDADLALFKASLPRLINQPGGNQLILNTMRAIAQYDTEGAKIVQEMRAGRLSRDQAFERLQSRHNPLDDFVKSQQQNGDPEQSGAPDQQGGRRTSSGIKWSVK